MPHNQCARCWPSLPLCVLRHSLSPPLSASPALILSGLQVALDVNNHHASRTGACGGGNGSGRSSKVSDRVALLKRALAGESAAQHKMQRGCPLLTDAGALGGCAGPSAEDADAISALFELSSSM